MLGCTGLVMSSDPDENARPRDYESARQANTLGLGSCERVGNVEVSSLAHMPAC